MGVRTNVMQSDMTEQAGPAGADVEQAVEQVVAQAVERLADAASTGTPGAPVRDLLGADNIAAAYAVQQRLVARRVESGARPVGHKVGLTSPGVQAQLGVDQPDFGVLLDDMDVSSLPSVPVTGLLQPRIEAEVAFVLGSDLDGDLDRDTVRAAVAGVLPALEIVDSRVAGWDIRIADTVADNASSGLFVLGGHSRGLDEVEPRDVTMELLEDGLVVSTGDGTACLGDPLEALTWLARTAQESGDPLRAGQVVLSGALGPMVDVRPGSTYEARIHPLGDVSATFDNEDPR